MNVLKMRGRGFGWGSGHGLVGCDGISHHIPIAFSFPEILHAHVQYTTPLYMSLNSSVYNPTLHIFKEIVAMGPDVERYFGRLWT